MAGLLFAFALIFVGAGRWDYWQGWLYMVLLITAYDLGRRVQWPWKNLIVIALAGTIPFLSFVAEHRATKNVRAYLAGEVRSPAIADSTAPR